MCSVVAGGSARQLTIRRVLHARGHISRPPRVLLPSVVSFGKEGFPSFFWGKRLSVFVRVKFRLKEQVRVVLGYPFHVATSSWSLISATFRGFFYGVLSYQLVGGKRRLFQRNFYHEGGPYTRSYDQGGYFPCFLRGMPPRVFVS